MTRQEKEKGEVPAQLTSEEGEGRDLYACHSKDAVFARLLFLYQENSHVMTSEGREK